MLFLKIDKAMGEQGLKGGEGKVKEDEIQWNLTFLLPPALPGTYSYSFFSSYWHEN